MDDIKISDLVVFIGGLSVGINGIIFCIIEMIGALGGKKSES